MKDLKRQALELGSRLAQMQQELETEQVEVSSGGGAVKITINGQQQVQKINLSSEAVDPQDIGLLEDLLVVAVNEAIAKSQELARRRLEAITGGLKLPGLI